MQVFVYWNLHKNCWSIKHKGKVIHHADQVVMANVQFKVSEAGRQRVIKEKRKNVHAGVNGHLLVFSPLGEGRPYSLTNPEAVSYNPYLGPSFYKKNGGDAVFTSNRALLDNKIVFM